jgi:CubicO group peptidase (beta-lactamase class C family)
MLPLADAVDEIAQSTDFTGVVSVDQGGEIEFAKAYGMAHRGLAIANTVDTRFAIASGTKGLTALTIASLIGEGKLSLSTTVRSVLGTDLPLIDDGVTIEHLLGHRSGIGEYYDDDHGEINDYHLPAPQFDLLDTEQYVKVLDGHPQAFPPGKKFSYNNGGFVVLALIAERVSGTPFHELVVERVCRPAGMVDTEFLRTDEPATRTALGYLNYSGVWRTNTFHLPIRGNGDGGIYTTVADFSAFWPALFAGEIVPTGLVNEMVRPHSDVPEYSLRYGLGFWLRETKNVVFLEGYDPGVSFRSVHIPETKRTYTVVSNYSEGAWPVAERLAEVLELG